MIRTSLMSLSLAAVVLASGSALAAEDQGGLELGARLGYGIALGKAAKDQPMSDGLKGQIPIQIDVGYRINPNIYAGAYFMYGIGLLNKDKLNCDSCSGSDMRFGIQAQYHLMPAETFDPWIGLGIGYEIASFSSSSALGDVKSSSKGMEFIHVQVGGDYKVSPNLAIGPFATFAIGQYSSGTVEVGGNSKSDDIQDKELHQWLMLGVRGSFRL